MNKIKILFLGFLFAGLMVSYKLSCSEEPAKEDLVSKLQNELVEVLNKTLSKVGPVSPVSQGDIVATEFNKYHIGEGKKGLASFYSSFSHKILKSIVTQLKNQAISLDVIGTVWDEMKTQFKNFTDAVEKMPTPTETVRGTDLSIFSLPGTSSSFEKVVSVEISAMFSLPPWKDVSKVIFDSSTNPDALVKRIFKNEKGIREKVNAVIDSLPFGSSEKYDLSRLSSTLDKPSTQVLSFGEKIQELNAALEKLGLAERTDGEYSSAISKKMNLLKKSAHFFNPSKWSEKSRFIKVASDNGVSRKVANTLFAADVHRRFSSSLSPAAQALKLFKLVEKIEDKEAKKQVAKDKKRMAKEAKKAKERSH
ncbi:hypothetical protein KAT92_04955 [Candidatus Babeliales bacterium]|nr:hypothetical protein [Candidatus Babeliales bacterium]